ncbi:MAG: hypothetical protein CMJ89_11495 [Planctomycetes bacterium]|nr:hypothetical protein [Planctomycetota bacterium]
MQPTPGNPSRPLGDLSVRFPFRLLPFVVTIAAGCGDKAAPVTEPETAVADEETLLFEDTVAFPEGVDENLKLLDPLADDWRSETLHERAKKVLALLFERLSSGEALDSDDLLAADFETATLLRPDSLESLYTGEGITVHSFEGEGEAGSRKQLQRLLSSAFTPFDEATAHAHFKIVSVDIADAERFETTVLVHIDGKNGQGLVQQNMRWTVEWSAAPDDEQVRIRNMRSRRFEEIVLANPLFVELTNHVFGKVASYRDDFLEGAGDHRNRVDRLLGSPFLGMQGLALGDANGDGIDDVYVPFHAGVANRLFLRKPDGTIADASRRSRIDYLENTPSALLIDLDNDGDQDLAFGTDRGVGLARNRGGAAFGPPRVFPPSTVGEIYSLSAADPDLDGDLDVYPSRYGSGGILGAFPTPYHDANNGARNIYLENDEGRFIEKTEELGFAENNQRFSLASVWDDFDADGRLDLYVANDFGRNNLYRNEGERFRDVAGEFQAEDMAAGMGVSAADFDADGDVDLYITNMFSSAGLRIVPQADRFMDGTNRDVHRHYERHARGNTLLENQGGGRFKDITDHAGVAVGGWGWGASWLDINNDGLQDIYAPNGFLTNRDPEDI